MSKQKDIRFNRDRMLMGAEYYKQFGITPQTSQIRVEMELVSGIGSYAFDLKKKGKDKSVTEKTIQENDLFIARAIGLALMVEADAAPGTAPLLSYPLLDGLHLPAGIKGFTDTKAYSIYGGNLAMKTDQTVNFSGFPTTHFLHVPETQPVAVLNSEDSVVSAGIQPQFCIGDVLYELPEILRLAANHQLEIKLEAPAFAVAVPEGYTAKVVLLIEGWLYAGGAQDKFKDSKNDHAVAI